MRLKVMIILINLLCYTPLAYADTEKLQVTKNLLEMDLEELVQIQVVKSASKYQQDITQAPASVSIVTAKDIQLYGYRTLADLLSSLRGFYSFHDGSYDYVGIRGFLRPEDYNTRLLLLIDGHRTNEPLYQYAAIGSDFFLEMDNIERVEVIRGAGSSLYGANAIFAVVNVITKSGKVMKGTEIAAATARHNTYQARATYGNQFDNEVDLFLSVSGYNYPGQRLFFPEYDTPTSNNGIADRRDSDSSNRLFAKLTYADFTFTAARVSRIKHLATGAFGTAFNAPDNKFLDTRDYIDLTYKHGFANDLDVLARINYDTYTYKAVSILADSLIENRDYNRGRWWEGALQVTKSWDKHKLVMGIDYFKSVQQDLNNFNVDPYEIFVANHQTTSRWAVYAQDEITLLDNVTLNAGLRYDSYGNFGGTTNPRLALIYNPLPKTSVKLLYGSAFRAPSTYESSAGGGLNVASNTELRPETIKSYEMVLEHQFNQHSQGLISLYHYDLQGLISQEFDSALEAIIYKNQQRVDAQGVELELNGQWNKKLGGRISYSYQKNTNANTGTQLSDSPYHLAKFNGYWHWSDNYSLGMESRYVSSGTLSKSGVYGKSNGYNVTHLSLTGYPWGKGLEIAFSLYNVFDKKYTMPASDNNVQNALPQERRNFRLKLTYRF